MAEGRADKNEQNQHKFSWQFDAFQSSMVPLGSTPDLQHASRGSRSFSTETRHQTRAPSLHELHGARGGEIMSCEHLLAPAAHGSMGVGCAGHLPSRIHGKRLGELGRENTHNDLIHPTIVAFSPSQAFSSHYKGL